MLQSAGRVTTALKRLSAAAPQGKLRAGFAACMHSFREGVCCCAGGGAGAVCAEVSLRCCCLRCS